MKKSLLTIAFALATASMIFAAPQAGTPAAGSNAPKAATTHKTAKAAKKGHRGKKATSSTAAKPAAK